MDTLFTRATPGAPASIKYFSWLIFLKVYIVEYLSHLSVLLLNIIFSNLLPANLHHKNLPLFNDCMDGERKAGDI